MLDFTASYKEIYETYKEDIDFTHAILENVVPKLNEDMFEQLISSWFKAKYNLINLFNGQLSLSLDTNARVFGEDPPSMSSLESMFSRMYDSYVGSPVTVDMNKFTKDKKINPILKSLHKYIKPSQPLYLSNKNVRHRPWKECFSVVDQRDVRAGDRLVAINIKQIITTLFEQNAIDLYTNLYDGQYKISKLFTAICPDDIFVESLNTMWSRFIQKYAINDGVITTSVAPHAFLLMSEGNDWWSCLRIQNHGGSHDWMGEYAGGVLSYMCDQASVICSKASTKKGMLNNSLEIPLLDWRMLAFVDIPNGSIVTSREYSSSREVYAAIARALLMASLAEHHEVSPNWKKSRDDYGNLNEVSSLHYQDVFRSDTNEDDDEVPEYAVQCKLSNIGRECSATFGSVVYCLICGEEVTRSQSLVCDDCLELDDYFKCFKCSTHFPKHIHVDRNGRHHCPMCVKKYYANCAKCDREIQLREERYAAGGTPDSSTRNFYCSECMDGLIQCNSCGYYNAPEETYKAYPAPETYCEYCIEHLSRVSKCKICNQYIILRSASEYEGQLMCGICYKQILEERGMENVS